MMTDATDHELELIDGAEGSFWSPYYAISYFVSYMVGSYMGAAEKCGCDQSLSMT